MRKMRLYQWALIALMALALAACGGGVGGPGSGTATQAAGSTGILNGVVYQIGTTNGVSGATVSVGTKSATTGSDGSYTITGVAVGNSPAYVSATNYQKTSQNVIISANATTDNNFYMTPAYPTVTTPANSDSYVLFAWNNLGIHCDQNDYSAFCVLPPFNVLEAQLINRNSTSNPVVSGVTIKYYLHNKQDPSAHTNFWSYSSQFHFTNSSGNTVYLTANPNVGTLTGALTNGTMSANTDGLSFSVSGLPVTPYDDDGTWDPYGYAIVNAVDSNGNLLQGAQVNAEVPVSTEMTCNNCHGTTSLDPTLTSQASILYDHDNLSGTHLYTDYQSGTVHLCAECHADPALGAVNAEGATEALSSAMHKFHGGSINGTQVMDWTTAAQNTTPDCFNCHPGPKTQCLRGIMFRAGKSCHNCHGTVADMGSLNRTPWTAGSMPQCGTCHDPAHYAENSGKLYKDSVLEDAPNRAMDGILYCEACHSGTHAELMTTATATSINNADSNVATTYQGDRYWIHQCTICHPNKSGYVHH